MRRIIFIITATGVLLLSLIVYKVFRIPCFQKDPAPQPKYSLNPDQSKKIGMFITEYVPDKRILQLDSVFIFEIDTAWLEYSWKHICLDDRLQYVKGKNYNFIVEASYKGHVLTTYYYLGKRHFGSPLNYNYTDTASRETIKLVLFKDTSNIFKLTDKGFPIDTITFSVLKVSR
jgi:hypothetical protein